MGWRAVVSTLEVAVNLLLSFVPFSVEQWIREWSFIVYRDAVFLSKTVALIYKIWSFKKKDYSVVAAFRENLAENPDKISILSDEEIWTFKRIEVFSNKVAKVFSSWLSRGDCVAIFMTNRPDYGPFWFGLSKIGVVSALINGNLARKQLLHCIRAANSKALIYSSDLEHVVSEVASELSDIRLYCLDTTPRLAEATYLGECIESATEAVGLPEPSFADKLLYVYTSGTTGLPKPAIVTHAKILKLYLLASKVVMMQKHDIVYNALPMYHISGILGSLTALVTGATLVVRKKFSASSFIPDCIKHKVTVALYIGEVCRYVLNTERRPEDKQHQIQMIAGNGLRSDVWRGFMDRFGVKKVVEYYGATESHLVRVNDMNKVGSCGYLPYFAPQWFIDKFCGALVAVDPDTGDILRGPNGFCLRPKPGEPSMMLGMIIAGFDGYLSKAETEKKIIRNVFKEGDIAFITGDLFVMDSKGWLYFHDRLGDTFRWKGENVSTTEVEKVLMSYSSIKESSVYGVEVKGNEGRAGMAAIVVEDNFDSTDFCKFLAMELPKYARPLFLRITPKLEYTSTMKIIKTKLRNEGFMPNNSGDSLLVRSGNTFVPLTQDIYNEIESEKYNF